MEHQNTPFIDIQAIIASTAPENPLNPFPGVNLTILSPEKRMEMAIQYLQAPGDASTSKRLTQCQICKLLRLEQST